MLDKILSDAGWAQAAIAALVALFTLGTLIAVSLSAWLQWLDRRDTKALDAPEIETKVRAVSGQVGWWELIFTVRNFGVTRLETETLAVIRPRNALLLERASAMKRGDDVNRAERFVGSTQDGKKQIQLPLSLAPVGHEPQHLMHGHMLVAHGDSATISCFLHTTPSHQERKARLRLISRRKRSADRIIRVPIHISIPAVTNKRNA